MGLVYIYIYLEPVCPVFWGFNPPKQAPFQSKQWSFGFQVYIYIPIHEWLIFMVNEGFGWDPRAWVTITGEANPSLEAFHSLQEGGHLP